MLVSSCNWSRSSKDIEIPDQDVQDTLTCSLTAIQLIETQEALKGGVSKLPLLAAILYCPTPYSSEKTLILLFLATGTYSDLF
ncbi:hypothetical protein [Proteiniphilum acetatigenes]|uniref:hypothetical protein n=1 Tax=Proteiniphilum acetatigenes TaxID=294710 RepID=UPI000371D57B|nr:hypothetical protein [Proteiniphilum acetatigenes]SFK31849.1 hypothetical protein SAMN05216357_101291 [Porphyromonadaceae bacterium KH3CP3RA]